MNPNLQRIMMAANKVVQWTPYDLTNLDSYYDMSDASTVQQLDVAGQARNLLSLGSVTSTFFQNTSGNQPLYPRSVNGRDALDLSVGKTMRNNPLQSITNEDYYGLFMTFTRDVTTGQAIIRNVFGGSARGILELNGTTAMFRTGNSNTSFTITGIPTDAGPHCAALFVDRIANVATAYFDNLTNTGTPQTRATATNGFNLGGTSEYDGAFCEMAVTRGYTPTITDYNNYRAWSAGRWGTP